MAVKAPQAAVPAPVPASLSVAGGAGCNELAPYGVAAKVGQTVLRVGVGGMYQTIGAAVAAAQNGDLILVQPGTYVNDFADVIKQITIAGAGGMVNLLATEAPPNEKGIFVVDASCQIDNLTFQGAAIDSSLGGNAAGIRYQGGNMVLHNDAFIGNQNGILAGAVDGLPQNTVTILHSTFDDNGNAAGPDAGYTHNCYISTGISSLVAQGDIFERANVGHELKSRAQSNLIRGNIFYDGPTGTASYSIDLPDGGADTVSGNVIEKGPLAQNNAIIHFGGEGIPYAGSALSVTGNRFVNDLGQPAVAVLNQTVDQVSITGNEFDYFADATLASGPFTQSGNFDQNGVAIAPSSSNQFVPGSNTYDFSGDSLPHSVTFTVAGGVLGGGGLLSVTADAGHVTVLGGSGGLNYVEAPGWGGSFISTQAGASDTVVAPGQDTVESAGQDSIVGGAGNLTVQVSGTATIAGAAGNNAYVITGAASIAGAGGGDTVQVGGAGARASVTGTETFFQGMVNGGTLALAIDQGGAEQQATVTGGAALAVYSAGMNVTTAGGSSGAAITFGTGTVAACLSNGPDTIHAGTGAEDIIVTASAKIYAGSGALSVFGRSESGTATIFGAGGTVLIGGDSGGIAYRGEGARNTVQAALSNITLAGGAGLMSVQGGSGQIVQGGRGGLIFTTSGGADSITTQADAHDTVVLANASIVVSNGYDVIAAGGGNSMVTANGAARISGSTGSASYVLNGADTLTANGYTQATVGGAANARVTAQGSLTSLTDQGGVLAFSQVGNADGETATVTGGATLISQSSQLLTVISLNARGGSAVLGGGHESVVAAAGTSVQAGSGADSVAVDAGGAAVQGGTGALTVNLYDWVDSVATTIAGGAGLLAVNTGYGNLVFTGGTGAATLGLVSGYETVTAGSGNITLAGGNEGTVFVAGGGSAVVALAPAGGTITFGGGTTSVTEAAWGNPVIYDFNAGQGGGEDSISGFRGGVDQLVFNNVSVQQESVVGGSTEMTLSDGTHLCLLGVVLA